MASFLRGDIRIFEQWNDRFHAEFGALNNDNLNTLPNDGKYGTLPDVDFKPGSRVSEVYGDYLFMSEEMEELKNLLENAQRKYFAPNAPETLIQKYNKLDAEAKKHEKKKALKQKAKL